MNNDTQQQFLRAYEEHSEALFRHCTYKIGDPDLAKDLLQEAFTKTWTYLTKGQVVKNIRAFLYKILNNLIIDEYRKKKNSSLDTLMEDGFDRKIEESSTAEEKVDGAIALDTLKKLPEPYRAVLFMKFVEQLSLKEIAARTRQTQNTVAVKIHRGLAKMKALFHREARQVQSHDIDQPSIL